MVREKQFLLGFLGVLGGGFVALLAVKLFIPRPPAGAGPDIDAPARAAAPQIVVEPPALDTPAEHARTASPAPADGPAPAPAARYAAGSSFARRDPFVTQAAAVEAPPGGDLPTADDGAAVEPLAARRAAPAGPEPASAHPPLAPPARDPAAHAAPPPSNAGAPRPIREAHVTVSGDSWWGIAERAYGDGRYYRALYAWNRQLDPRVSLVPGTRLEIPTTARLEAAWPMLVPGTSPATGAERR